MSIPILDPSLPADNSPLSSGEMRVPLAVQGRTPRAQHGDVRDGLEYGSHDGSHGPFTDEFAIAFLADRQPLVDIAQALNMTVAGIVAHQSALKGGELLRIPQFTL